MRNKPAIIAGMLTGKITKLRAGGTALPGLVAERLAPGLLADFVRVNFPKGLVFVTGTNGKTTTTRLVTKILEDSGHTVLTNKAGSNLPRGILASFLAQSDMDGHIEADMAVLEVDEGYFPQLMIELKPKTVVVSNIFRDQLDRYGEVDAIVQAFVEAFNTYTPDHIVFNADDPLVYSIARLAKLNPTYFGINNYPVSEKAYDYAPDIVDDPIHHKKLEYSQRYFSHIGKYRSVGGGFERPDPEISAENISNNSNHKYKVVVKNTTDRITVNFNQMGLYNIYNLLTALSVGSVLGIALADASSSTEAVSEAFGRAEQQSIHGKTVTTLLIKNPTGFNQVISNFLAAKPYLPVLFIINDKLADGRDISWLWDSNLEVLGGKQSIVVSGSRAFDMALRLKYAGINNVEVLPNLDAALTSFTQQVESGGGYIVPTYTALLELQKYLHKHDKKGKWL